MSSFLDTVSLKKLQIELKKKSKLEWLGILLLGAAVLFMGGNSAFGDDFTWEGDGSDDNWSTAANWDVGSGYPNEYDNVTMIDPFPTDTCIMDVSGTVILSDFHLAGDSPTKMVINVADGDLSAAALYFDPYGEIDIEDDRSFTSRVGIVAWGSVFVQVGADGTCHFAVMSVQDPAIISPSNGITCSMHSVVSASGTLAATSLTIDADTEMGECERDREGFRFYGPTDTFTIDNGLTLKAQQEDDPDCDDSDAVRRAILWVDAGTIAVTNGSSSVLNVDGGDDQNYRRAEIDVDGTLLADITIFRGGYAAVDVATGQYFTSGEIQFDTGAYVVKTGAGTVRTD